MTRDRPETVQAIKERRDSVLRRMTSSIPYIQFLGVEFERRGDELTAILPYKDMLIGNPELPAIHGGVTSAFLEVASITELTWSNFWEVMESRGGAETDWSTEPLPPLPKTIDFTVDFLRSGLPRDAYARARVNRSGRRYASVHVEAWQDNRSRLFAQATGHFLMPE
jgi:acyl-coenzyme A thioesterase PaaI-like protein